MSKSFNNTSLSASGSKPAPRQLAAIILAAGKGKRMNSDLPKVVHPVAGRPMVWWVVQACRECGANPIVLVIGHGGDAVREAVAGDDRDLAFVTQEQQLGTGHAAVCAQPVLQHFQGDVLVLGGDGPLIRARTLHQLHQLHLETHAAATLATSVIPDPTGYGRIVREKALSAGSAKPRFNRIVEHKDASSTERTIREVNPSYYCFDATLLFELLTRLDNHNASGEFYITDVFKLLLQDGKRVEVIDAVPPEDVLSINDPQQLAEVDAILRKRLNRASEVVAAEVVR